MSVRVADPGLELLRSRPATAVGRIDAIHQLSPPGFRSCISSEHPAAAILCSNRGTSRGTAPDWRQTPMTTDERVEPDLAEIKSRQQRSWASGNYGAVGARIQPIAELLVDAADLRSGSAVLDVATGPGNAALAAARLGCAVTGIDYVPELLVRARARAAAEGFDIDFATGDAEALAFADASFDAVVSVVGVMFATDQAKAAAELLRVCRPGGTIALA